MTAEARKTGLGLVPDDSTPNGLAELIAHHYEEGTGRPCDPAAIGDLVQRVTWIRARAEMADHEKLTKEEVSVEHAALLGALRKVIELTRRDTLSDELEWAICHRGEQMRIDGGIGRSCGPSWRAEGEGPSLYDLPELLAPYLIQLEAFEPAATRAPWDAAGALLDVVTEWSERNGLAVSSYHSTDHGRTSPFLGLVMALGKAIGIRKQLPTWRDNLLSRKSIP